MADTDILQVIAEARVDARSLSEFVFKPANFIVSRRLAPSINTLQYYIDRANSVNNAFSKSVSDATTAADIAISAANTANQNAIGLIDSVTNQATQSVENAIRGVAIDANLVTDALATVVPIHDGITTRTQLDKNREHITILDFFFPDELAAYQLSPKTFDAHRPVQAFFDYITDNYCGIPSATGHYYISKGVTYNRTSVTICIRGDLTLEVLGWSKIDVLFHYAPGRERTWLGHMSVIGNGGVYYHSRTVNVGVRFGGGDAATIPYMCSHNKVGSISAGGGFIEFGVYIDNLTTSSNFGDIQTSRCGSGMHYDKNWSFWTDYTFLEYGPGNDTLQSNILKVTDLPPENLRSPCMVGVEGTKQLYYVKKIDRVNKTLETAPWMDPALVSGKLNYFFGAGVYIQGGDASVCRVQKVSSMYNGITLWIAALYPPIIDQVVSQFNGIAIAVGLTPAAAHLGGTITGLYCEDNTYDFVKVTRHRLNMLLTNTTGFRYDKVSFPCALADKTGTLRLYDDFEGFGIQTNGYFPRYMEDYKKVVLGSTAPVIVGGIENEAIISIEIPRDYLITRYNNRSENFVVMKERAYSSQMHYNKITFTAPTGYTVNAGSQVVFDNLGSISSFVLNVDGKDIKLLKASPENSTYKTSIRIPLLEVGSRKTVTFTVPNITVSPESFYVTIRKYLKEVEYSVNYKTGNTFEIIFKNSSELPVDFSGSDVELVIKYKQ